MPPAKNYAFTLSQRRRECESKSRQPGIRFEVLQARQFSISLISIGLQRRKDIKNKQQQHTHTQIQILKRRQNTHTHTNPEVQTENEQFPMGWHVSLCS